ncbi:MAG: hypothetical protein ABIN24_04400, partial [Dyadobacter sp.]
MCISICFRQTQLFQKIKNAPSIKCQRQNKDESHERDRDLFLFQVYTGFYYNDLQILRKVQVHTDVEHGQYIISERDKNDNPTIVPLFKFPYAKEIIARYMDRDPNNPMLFKKSVF